MSAPTAARFRARIARTGVQQYESGPEYRDARDVFDPASLASLDGVRVQIGHAPGAAVIGHVVPGTAGRVDRGDTEGNSYLTAVLAITDASAVAAIRGGQLRGISCGYDVQHVIRDGRKHQTRIMFDHVAVLRHGVERPRCGEHCSITQDRQDSDSTVMTLRIDSELTQAEQDALDREQARRDHLAWLAQQPDRQPARYHAGPVGLPRADALTSDDAFRAALAARDPHIQRADSTTTATPASTAATPACGCHGCAGTPAPGTRTSAPRGDSAAAADESFRAALVGKLGTDQGNGE